MFAPLSVLLLCARLVALSQGVEVTTSKGSLTAKNQADLKEIGVPAYPGSRLRADSNESPRATLGLWVSEKGFRLVALKYESPDGPDKILAYYRKALARFGTVLQCPGGTTTSSGLTCKDHEMKAGEVDLMAGSSETRRIVGVEPAPGGGTRFELVYLRTKGVDAH